MLQVTIYGIVKSDDWRDNRGYSLIDLTYLYDGAAPFNYSDILEKRYNTYYIAGTNYAIIPRRYTSGDLKGQLMADKVTIREITVGIQQVNPMLPPQLQEVPPEFIVSNQFREE